MSVSIVFNRDGTPHSTTAMWWLAPEQLLPRVMLFFVRYEHATADGLGKPEWMFALTTRRDGGRMKGAVARFELPDGRTWTYRSEEDPAPSSNGWVTTTMDFSRSTPGKEINPDLVNGLDAIGVATATIFTPEGEALASNRYDFSGLGRRDDLFRQAWAEAEKEAKNWRRCEKRD